MPAPSACVSASGCAFAVTPMMGVGFIRAFVRASTSSRANGTREILAAHRGHRTIGEDQVERGAFSPLPLPTRKSSLAVVGGFKHAAERIQLAREQDAIGRMIVDNEYMQTGQVMRIGL